MGRIIYDTGDVSDDEKRVLELVEEGLSSGREVYGPLEIDEDNRDWLEEAIEELRDALVYIAAKLVEIKRRTS